MCETKARTGPASEPSHRPGWGAGVEATFPALLKKWMMNRSAVAAGERLSISGRRRTLLPEREQTCGTELDPDYMGTCTMCARAEGQLQDDMFGFRVLKILNHVRSNLLGCVGGMVAHLMVPLCAFARSNIPYKRHTLSVAREPCGLWLESVEPIPFSYYRFVGSAPRLSQLGLQHVLSMRCSKKLAEESC